VGMLLITGGLLLMTTIKFNSTWTVLLPGFIVAGFGIGMVNPVLASASISVVEPQRSGMASGTNNTFRQVGIATGIAILGAIFQSQIISHTSTALRHSAVGRVVLHQGGAGLAAAMTAGEVRQTLPHIPVAARATLLHAYKVGFATTMDNLMVIGAIVAFVGTVGAFALVRQRDFVVMGGPPPAAGTGGADAGDVVGAGTGGHA
jgi:hypothetical protein